MKTARLSPVIVGVVGTVVALLAIGLIFFLLIKPTQDNITLQQGRLDLNAPGTSPEDRQRGLDQNKKKGLEGLKQAKINVQKTKIQWQQVEATTMPPLDASDRSKYFRQLTYELTRALGPDLQKQLLAGGVTSPTRFTLPSPPLSPNDPMIRSGWLVIPLGTVTVSGNFRQILANFYDWQYFNRLVVVDGLSLNGNSPYMQGSYNATLYIKPQNGDRLQPPLGKAGGAAPAGGAPSGGFPGAGGSYPGAGGYPGGGSAYPGAGRG